MSKSRVKEKFLNKSIFPNDDNKYRNVFNTVKSWVIMVLL